MIWRDKTSVLVVCTGNICRSPTADGVLRRLVREAGLERLVDVDSAGTHDYHVGEAPDERAQRHARRRGYELGELRARQVAAVDFERFDLILAMDRGHLALLERAAPAEHRHKLRLFMEFADGWIETEVPDPYYGGDAGFERVLDMIEAGAHGVLAELRAALRAS
ncbi:MAG TPA: low molecular weight protein-tyrosine-phosphatase [Burkholderiales bacterium]|nr:low molecular weight protein-tyrosine-phosphatase [Burkholderiales bacterium]